MPSLYYGEIVPRSVKKVYGKDSIVYARLSQIGIKCFQVRVKQFI